MYPGKTRPREKPNKTLLEKIFIMKPEYNHEPRLQPANPDKGYWLGQSPKLISTKPNTDSAPDPK